MKQSFSELIRVASLVAAFIPTMASAALSDEIQVYTDDINAPGEPLAFASISAAPISP